MSDNVLSLVELTHSFGERPILDGVTLGINRGAKVGLIGSNGAGKSTLLKIIGNRLFPDSGEVILRGGENLHFVEQVPALPQDKTARQILREALRPAIEAVEAYQAASANLSPEADALLEEVERLNGWDWEHTLKRAAQMLHIETLLDHPVGQMSGAQQFDPLHFPESTGHG